MHRRGGRLAITHRGTSVAEHEPLAGKYQVRILPEHGPGAIARTARQRRSALAGGTPGAPVPEVEIRDLAVYEGLLGDTERAAPLLTVDPEAPQRLGVPAALALTPSEPLRATEVRA